MEGFVGHVWHDKQFRFSPTLRNKGKTPAINFEIKAGFLLLPKEHTLTLEDIRSGYKPDQRDEKIYNLYKDVVFNPTTTFAWYPEFRFDWIVKREEWADLNSDNGNLRLYHFEEAKYDDVFGRHLCAHFCGYYLPWNIRVGNSTTACDIYNDITPEKW